MRSIITILSTILLVASCAHMQTSTPWPTETPTPEDTAIDTATPSPTGTQPTGTPTSCPLLQYDSRQREIVPWIPLENQMQDIIDWLWINDRSWTECNQDHPELYTDALVLKQAASINTPGPGYYAMYGKTTDSTLRIVNDAGTEYIVGITSSSTTNTPTVTQTPTLTPTARPWFDFVTGDEGMAPVLNVGTTLTFSAYSGLDYYFLVAPGASSVNVVLKKYNYTPTVTPTPFPYIGGFDTDSGTPRASVPAFNQPIHGEDGLYVWADADGLHIGYVPTITPTPTNTNTPTATNTPTVTNTPTETPTITNTPEPTSTPTSGATATPTFCSVVVSGAGSTIVNDTYDFVGIANGCASYERRGHGDIAIVIDTTTIDPPNPYWVITDYDTYWYRSATVICDYDWSNIIWQTNDGSDDPPTTACE